MAEETSEANEATQEAQPQEERTFTQDEVNRLIGKEKAKYKGFSEYKKAAAELDELKRSQMSDRERIEAEAESERKRADEAEAELEALKAEAQRAKDAAEVSEATGVPVSILTADTSTREGIEALAAAVAALVGSKPSAPVFKADGTRAGAPKRTPQDQFAEFFEKISQ